MKFTHWIIFGLAFWIVLVPFLADDMMMIMLPNQITTANELVNMLRWDDLFLGLAIGLMSLSLAMREKPTLKNAGTRSLHWLQFGLGTWIAIAPFALSFDMTAFTWSHFVTGVLVSVFALLQLNLEGAKR